MPIIKDFLYIGLYWLIIVLIMFKYVYKVHGLVFACLIFSVKCHKSVGSLAVIKRLKSHVNTS